MKEKKWVNRLLNILLTIGIIVCVLVILFKVSFLSIYVNGDSMNPTIYNSEEGYMIKTNSLTKIKRFDIVAADVDTTNNSNRYWIKRVLGLPNETITLSNNELFVNGEKVEQTFDIVEKQDAAPYTVTLKDDEYLLFGDNRSVTAHAIVSKKQIIAKGGFISYSCKDDICSTKVHNDWKWL